MNCPPHHTWHHGLCHRDGHICHMLSPSCKGDLNQRGLLLKLEPKSQIDRDREGRKLSRSFSIRNKMLPSSKTKFHSHWENLELPAKGRVNSHLRHGRESSAVTCGENVQV